MQFDAAMFLAGLCGAGVDAASILTPDDLPPDWHYAWDERAAIMEYDGGMPREVAEALALADIRAWMSDVNGTRRTKPADRGGGTPCG